MVSFRSLTVQSPKKDLNLLRCGIACIGIHEARQASGSNILNRTARASLSSFPRKRESSYGVG